MNYLAHIYLSGDSEDIQLGNFIGDYVKGRNYEKYDRAIQQGILLHRKIDSYTDAHHAVRTCNTLFRPNYGKYAGIVSDMLFDHMLASNWNEYASLSLRAFTHNFHSTLVANYTKLPLQAQKIVPFLIQKRRLESYASQEGIAASLTAMSKHTTLPNHTSFAIEVLNKEFETIDKLFREFMQEIIGFVETEENLKIKKPA